MYHTGEYRMKEIVDMTEVSRTTLYRYLRSPISQK
ncbi:helix-turn-helix domain-containing protein [Cytobacillus purgationiresistens]